MRLAHVGMGRTGSSIQAASAQGGEELAAAGLHCVGMWARWTGPERNGGGPFRRFLRRPPERLRGEADRCLAWAGGVAAGTGATTLLHANKASRAVPFLQALAERVEARLIAYVRAPARWLPLACLQWGVVHKTSPGPVVPFAAPGHRLMAQCRAIQVPHAGLGPLLGMRAHPEGGDVVGDFGEAIGVRLRRPEKRLPSRPGPVEALLRAAFDSAFPDPVLPLAPARGPARPGRARRRAGARDGRTQGAPGGDGKVAGAVSRP